MYHRSTATCKVLLQQPNTLHVLIRQQPCVSQAVNSCSSQQPLVPSQADILRQP